jgi:hypothetical protein
MNPQITMTRMAGANHRLLVVDYPAGRTAGRKTPAVQANPADLIQDTTVDAAERDRQDALAFLHKLVMG